MPQVIDLPSPCISVCVLDPKTRYCLGCLRTSDEIAGWRNLDHGARLALLDRLSDRRSEMGRPMRKTTRRRAMRRAVKLTMKETNG